MKTKTLILYSTREGQTKKIASFIADKLSFSMTSEIKALSGAMDINLKSYQQVIVGASVHYGRFNRILNQFIKQHIVLLNQMPTAFFSVNLLARKPEKCSPQTNSYVRQFLLKTPWKPLLSEVFAGALRYPHYRWWDKMLIQLIMSLTQGETDTSKEVEYTDWNQVNIFCQNFLKIIQN
ncbi:menaquinone-dependent protoporphyrinogen IX dehydrogenase [Candidatus Hamiltonella defensa]|uniref:Protoporphyrinogen IX dehydrogenase [quinone] n=1 Tax=Hamiltonella defensa subsp. Acyrthosiphon pisum (strain 5AT) TaxID=572265 RepID=C4K718_HAMD5|nr:menaquinone-dependent protoporphyrinogen IX dehydrogenase [Candidatus Hamiltonella defensa]ACQ68361.1 protoporphyrin flavoprotein oxidase, O2 dependent [Candidatus Hamiltonella defensa 5AT (Acyrthosiphon pisum)]ATW22917.1 protoporphyrinogen oxidase [Candidatus Hamiltonella defensa]